MLSRDSQILMLGCLLLVSCKKENICDCLKSTGPTVTEMRSLASFDRIEVFKNVHVTLYQDSVEYAEVKAGSHLIDLIRTEVNGSTLTITNENKCNWVRSFEKEIHVNVHLKKLSGLHHGGAKDVRCGNQIHVTYTDIRIYNSADAHLNFTGDSVYVRQILGAGDFYLSGSSDFLYAYAGSSGYIYAGGFTGDSVQVDHRGSGDIHVSPQYWMLANMEGRGNLYYTGNPVVESYIKGSGRIFRE